VTWVVPGTRSIEAPRGRVEVQGGHGLREELGVARARLPTAVLVGLIAAMMQISRRYNWVWDAFPKGGS